MNNVLQHPMGDANFPVSLAEELFNTIIEEYELDASHTARTAERFVKMIKDLTTIEEVNLTTFPNMDPKVDQMIVVSPIPFYSLCAHHVIPFFGTAHVAYIPDESIIGLSKIPRLVKATAKGLHIQEVLTQMIADILNDTLEPVGVAVVMKAQHLCMMMRGVQTMGAVTTTSSLKGVFLHPKLGQPGPKDEFFAIVNNGGKG